MALSLRRGRVTAIAERHEGLVRCEVDGEAGGALPLGLSDTLRALVARELITTTVTAGACFGGDVECVTAASAFAWASARGFDAVVCAIGPGIVGTGSSLGHGGVAAADAANTAAALGGA